MGRCAAAVLAAAAALPAAVRGQDSLPWTYANPERWHALNSDAYGECRLYRQSPVELREAEAREGSRGFLKFWTPRAPPRTVAVTNTGQALQVFVRQLGITLTGSHIWSQHTLEQVVYHAPSEHVLDGVRYPLERQSIFLPSDAPQLRASGQSRYPIVVLSELFELSNDSPDPQIRQLISGGLGTDLTGGRSLDISYQPLFDISQEEFYVYEGSLTTPPCSEVVTWHVAAGRRTASEDQLQLFHTLVKEMAGSAPGGMPLPAARYPMPERGNARPLQPTNGRPVTRRRFFSSD
eukprot:TRINITY_DN5678_c0_g1_i1.p1 TRINITY_DN5678_c0_g1~~TRINITY_DN5678_c0_g1_i1.p1  ORF type:complete len:320 (+),score=110.44 TRINITY_DN5678_c0_g1_i1:83-961(+)